ncbi:MAG: DegT/DnrJ/EryC1/StrS family aminotransferase [Elusimicrobia bacterium]|nr:DegT/DnrJ/EryC1/StrS family aminotransferase [Elusimicrobiota bacterium]
MAADVIPLLSVRAQNAALAEELKAAAGRVIDGGAFILGPEHEAFELEFAAAVGARFALGTDSGTSALELALEAAGAGPGDEVIVPAFTFHATASAVSVLGAKPVFCDVDDRTLTLDPQKAAALAGPKTKAIIPVHIFGQPADMDPILKLAKAKNLAVIEDCAQSHLASYKGRGTGTMGNAGAFSFYPTKNLGAAGDAGALTTNDMATRDKLIVLRNCGRKPGDAYRHIQVGHNSRLDELQAAVLRVKLGRLGAWTQARRRLAKLYHDALKGLPLKLPPLGSGGTEPVFHLFTVRCGRRDALAEHLKRRGIASGVYYPIPAHLQPAYAGRKGKAGQCPVAERACAEVLSLPLYPELSDADAGRVVKAVRAFF